MAGLFNKTQEEYYQQSQTFEASGTGPYELLGTFFPTIPAAKADIRVFVDGAELDVDDYTYENRGATYSESMNKVIDMEFLDHKYNQTELRQRIAEKESELEELKKQLR